MLEKLVREELEHGTKEAQPAGLDRQKQMNSLSAQRYKLTLLLSFPPLCPACFLGCCDSSASGWRHRASCTGCDRNNLLPLSLCPSRPLRGHNSLASRSRNGALLASCSSGFRLAPMHVDVPEGDQGGCYAVQFILKSRAFLLELADYRLHQCFWHEAILSLGIGPKTVSAEGSWSTGEISRFHSELGPHRIINDDCPAVSKSFD